MKKRIGVIGLLLVMVLVLASCSAKLSAASLAGDWELVDVTAGENPDGLGAILKTAKDSGATVGMSFKDSTMNLLIDLAGTAANTEAINFEIKDGKFVADGVAMDIKLDGDKLTLTKDSTNIILQKKK